MRISFSLAFNNYGVMELGDEEEVIPKRYAFYEDELVIEDGDVMKVRPVLSMQPPEYIDWGQRTSDLWAEATKIRDAKIAIVGNRFILIDDKSLVRRDVELMDHTYVTTES